MIKRKEGIYLKEMNSYMIDSPQPSILNYWYNVGSMLGICIMIQIISGILVSMHYSGTIELSFNTVEHIMRDVKGGWIIRYIHSNMASIYFICLYIHIGKGIYYGSYRKPREKLWIIGIIIYLISMIVAFLGYCLVYGQMSHWGATVITNLITAIPVIGESMVKYIWGGYSVSNPTITRFAIGHYMLGISILGIIIIHLKTLHENGSTNPIGVNSNIDRISIYPYYIFKDIITILGIIIGLICLICYKPNILGHPDNYIKGNSLVTPMSIVPEWYLLPYYAILRSIPNKLMGVIMMISSILIWLSIIWTDKSILRGNTYKKLSKGLFILFIINFIWLGYIGQLHVEIPYIKWGQISTGIYFSYFILIYPLLSRLENILGYLSVKER